MSQSVLIKTNIYISNQNVLKTMWSVRERVARNQTNVNWRKKKKLFFDCERVETTSQWELGYDAIFSLQGKFNRNFFVLWGVGWNNGAPFNLLLVQQLFNLLIRDSNFSSDERLRMIL